MTPDLVAALDLELPSSTGLRRVELRIPSVLRTSRKLLDDGLPENEARSWSRVPGLVFELLDRIDGKRPSNPEVDALAADRTFVGPLLAHARDLFDTFRERGKVYALCPGCRTWEPEITFTAYALIVKGGIPSSFRGPYLAPTTLASKTLLAEGNRPVSLPRAARIRFELPSKFLGLSAPIEGGILGPVIHQEGEDGWEVDLFDDDDDDEGEDDELDEDDPDPPYKPTRNGPGYRALFRLSHAIEPAVTVEQLEALPCLDLFFLDLVHHLTVQAAVAADTPGTLTCPTCATKFLPIAARPGERVPQIAPGVA